MKLNKVDLIKAVSNDTNFYQNEVEQVVNSIFKIIPQILETGDSLNIRGFGRFDSKMSKKGISNITGKEIIPRKTIKFKASEEVYK